MTLCCSTEAPARWNFAYGANLNAQTVKRRRLEPLEIVPAVLRDHKLVFNHGGFAFFEETFANVEPCEGAEVHGALLRLTTVAMGRLVESEGGGGGIVPGYALVKVTAHPYNGGEPIEAHAFMSEPAAKRRGCPSRRYVRLIATGARQLQLEPAYVAEIEAIHPGTTTSIVAPPTPSTAATSAEGVASRPSVVGAVLTAFFFLASFGGDEASAKRLVLWTVHQGMHWIKSLSWVVQDSLYGSRTKLVEVVYVRPRM